MCSLMLLQDFIGEKMLTDRLKKDLAELEDSNFKSCFARSMALNSSQRKHTKTLLSKQKTDDEKTEISHSLRKDFAPIEDARRCSPASNESSRRESLCSSRISETPVENIVYQSQIDTLQWQLKQIKASRDMYKAVMRQMVTFLEKTHRSLDMLSTRLHQTRAVSRSRSEHQVSQLDTLDETAGSPSASFRDYTWKRQKKREPSPDEVPPEKLSQEAFRLLRTAKSLLNTEEPDLTNVNPAEDAEFLAQLAKEFPSNRTSLSFSMCPKLIQPDRECKISVAVKRNLSVNNHQNQQHEQHEQHEQQERQEQQEQQESQDQELDFDNNCVLSSTTMSMAEDLRSSEKVQKSPPSSHVGSTEDESGFSSMNSYQEVGLPMSTGFEEVRYKDILVRNAELTSNLSLKNRRLGKEKEEDAQSIDEVKLWQRPELQLHSQHRRWSSIPVEALEGQSQQQQPIKVLWV